MVPSINFDQMGKEEKIIGGCFQTTKRKVKHFFFKLLDICGHRFSVVS